MTMKVALKRTPTAYEFTVWIDPTKKGADGQPDPAYLRTYTFGRDLPMTGTGTTPRVKALDKPKRMTEAAYLAQARAQVKENASREIAAMADLAPKKGARRAARTTWRTL